MKFLPVTLDHKFCVLDVSTMHVAPFVSQLIAETAAREFNEGTKDPAGWAWFEIQAKPLALAGNVVSGILANIGGNSASHKELFMIGVEFGFRQGERGLNLYAALGEAETAWGNAGPGSSPPPEKDSMDKLRSDAAYNKDGL